MNIAIELKHCQQSIKRTGLSNGYVVSTVWLADITKYIDSYINALGDFIGYKEPGFNIFKEAGDYETMVFPADPNNDYEIIEWKEKDARRYHNKEDAIKGHDKMVAKWLNIS